MKPISASLLALWILASGPSASAHGGATHFHDDGLPTPAKTRIEEARKVIAASPEDPKAYPPLAMAFAARARETADGAYYDRAMATVEKALNLEPGFVPAQKAEAWILLGQHQFQAALEKARALMNRIGDDPMVHAMMTDAAIETGAYLEAEESAQWALDLDPGGVPGLTRAAYLRELFGDFDGAIDLMRQAYQRMPGSATEERAWLMTHVGHLYLLKNEPGTAETAHLEALDLFPDYHYAIANLARVRTAQGDHQAALELHRKHYSKAPHTPNLYDLALAMERAGRSREAAEAFREFEEKAVAESVQVDNSNHQLVDYYIDVADRPEEALRIARLELANRRDFRTLHAHARALHASGRYDEAHEEMQRALAVGVKYPEMQYHAGIIARDAGHREDARTFLEQSLRQAPVSVVSDAAAKALADL